MNETSPSISNQRTEHPLFQQLSYTVAEYMEFWRCCTIKISLSTSQIVAMLSNYSTSYNAVNVSLVLPIMKHPSLSYTNEETEEAAIDSLCSSSLIAGMILGQLFGGALGDIMGRMRAIWIVILLQVIASLGSAFFIWPQWPLLSVFSQLALWRFLLGIGAGGVYPLAAVLSSEQQQTTRLGHQHLNTHDDDDDDDDDDGTNGLNESSEIQNENAEISKFRSIALTFSTQGLGFITVSLLTWPLLLFLKEKGLDLAWRFLLAMGAIPGIILFLFIRCQTGGLPREEIDRQEENQSSENVMSQQLPDNDSPAKKTTITTAEFTKPAPLSIEQQPSVNNNEQTNKMRTVTRSQQNSGNFQLWNAIQSEPFLFRKLAGTAGTWFLFDVLFYGNTLFQPTVLEAAFGSTKKDDDFQNLIKVARDGLIITSLALPGYFASVLLLGRRTCRGLIHQTPKFIQMQGFFTMFLLYLIIGLYWRSLTKIPPLLLLLYGSTFFFANYGPNTTTFMLPSLTFSESCRSTLNGMSAAAGKLGALIGAAAFEPVSEATGDAIVMILCASVSLIALILTQYFVLMPLGSRRAEARSSCRIMRDGMDDSLICPDEQSKGGKISTDNVVV